MQKIYDVYLCTDTSAPCVLVYRDNIFYWASFASLRENTEVLLNISGYTSKDFKYDKANNRVTYTSNNRTHKSTNITLLYTGIPEEEIVPKVAAYLTLKGINNE